MKIIQAGDLERLKHPLKFTCLHCGCIFEADNTEYKGKFDQREERSWYEVECPTCKNLVCLNKYATSVYRIGRSINDAE